MEALSSRSTPPPKDIEQDVDVRRSRRAGRGSAKKTTMKVYPGSGPKQRARRSFRTPIQTIPLQGAETSEKSASRSFAMMPDQEDIFTPRSNIEGFLASAVEQPGPDNTTPDMPKMTETSSSDTTVFKIPDQPDGLASRRTQASSDPALTPGSKFTPRTNVFNWIHCLEEPEHTPIVRGDDLVNQPSSETRESITKHQEWGQEISLSPIYLSRTSEGKDDSPSTLTQAFKRVRRSFHIPVSQAMVMASQVATEQSLAATEENPVLVHASDSDDANPVVRKSLEEARESLFEKFGSNGDFGLELGLSAAESENLGLEVGLSAAESENLGFFVSQHLKGISASTLENLNAEVDTDLEERPISVLEDLNAEVGTDLEGRPISVLEDLNAEVGTDLEGRPISVLEDLNAEVGTDLEGRHISDFERLNAEVGTDLEERHLSDLENLNAEVGTDLEERHLSDLENLNAEVGTDLEESHLSDLENLNAEVGTDLEESHLSDLENLNAEVGTDLEERHLSDLENLNPEVGTDLEERHLSDLENLNSEVGTDLEERHLSDLENLNAEVGTDLEERHLSDLENLNAEVGTDLEESHLSDLENLNAEVGTDLEESHLSDLENLNAEVGTDLEERHLSDLENLNPEVGTDLEERHLSDLENLNSEVGTDLEERHLSDLEKASSEALSEKLDFFLQADLGMPSCVVSENLDAFVNGEDEDNNPNDIEDDQQMAADDETIQTEAAENVIHETMTAAKDLMSDEDNVNNMLNVEDEDNLNNMLNVKGTEAVAENRNGEEDGRFVMSKYSRCQLNMASEATLGVNAVNETGHVENAASNVLGQDFETILTSTPCSANMDVDGNTEENNTCGARVESVEGKGDQGSEMTGDAGVRHGELRKEKSFGSSRTSLTSKHGKITCSSSPKRTLKSTPAASAATPSVYDLSESSSSSSGDVRITKQRSSTPRKLTDNSKSLRKRGIGSAKSSKQNISPGRGSASRSKSKLSYSEWKSQQKGKGSPSRTMASFLDARYPLSSTPSDRSKKIFHSTKIHHSVHADGDPVLETQMTDSIPNISPIRPVARSDAEKQISSGRGVADASTDRDDQGGVEEGSARIPHRESVLVNQDEQMAELDEDSSDAVLPGFSPLATPYIDMNRKSQKSVAGQTSAQKPLPQPQTSGFGREPRKETEAARQPPRKRTKTNSDTALPRRSVKFFAERHSTMKLSKDAVEEIERVSEIFWDNTFKALETFALHAGRKTVKDEDVVLLMKTQGLIKDTEDLHDAIRQFLPMELRSELIPMAKP